MCLMMDVLHTVLLYVRDMKLGIMYNSLLEYMNHCLCCCCLMHTAVDVQGGIYPKLAGHIAHFLAHTLFKTSLIALTSADYRCRHLSLSYSHLPTVYSPYTLFLGAS